MSKHQHEIMARLSDAELAILDELRGEEERAVYLRRLLHEPSKGSEVAMRFLTDEAGRPLVIESFLAPDPRRLLRRGPRDGRPAQPVVHCDQTNGKIAVLAGGADALDG